MTYLKSFAAALLIATAPVLASAENPASAVSVRTVSPQPIVARTSHSGVFNGEQVAYTATVAENFVYDEHGAPQGYLTTIAYVRVGVADPASRPIMFLFNGGPGASSSPLHMGAFGPRRRDGSSTVENPLSPLNAFDLVFIDPVGTGFSRVFAQADGKQFWSRSGDARAVKDLIKNWLKENGREASPRFLAGQSYGTTRAAMILKNHHDITFDGVMLFALVGNIQGAEMPFVTSLPTMATTAWEYKKIRRGGRTIDQVYEQAVEFARGEYVTALIRGSSLPARDKRRIAEKMSALIGLPADLIAEKDLRIDKTTFMFELIKDRDLRTGLLDTRVTAVRDLTKTSGRDDPALGGGQTRPRDSGPNALDIYFRETLGFNTPERPYHGVNFDVNAAWDHEGMGEINPAIGEAMKRNPNMRLFWVGGYFDLTTPAYGARYAIDQAGIPGDRVTSALFPGGHSVFYDEDNRAALSRAVIRFVVGQPPAR